MRIDKFLDFLRSTDHLLIYGHGYLARFLAEFLKIYRMVPEGYIISGSPAANENDCFCIRDFDRQEGHIYGIALTVQEMYHDSAKKLAMEK